MENSVKMMKILVTFPSSKDFIMLNIPTKEERRKPSKKKMNQKKIKSLELTSRI